MFRRAGGVGDGVSIDTFHPFDGTPSLADIFTNVSNSRIQAAQKTLAFLEQTEDPQSFIAAAQRMIYLKGTDSHDYKFSSAMLEDYRYISPEIRARFLASTVFWLDGNEKPDNRLVARTRAALS